MAAIETAMLGDDWMPADLLFSYCITMLLFVGREKEKPP
ncbi:hypothetical protein OHAE_4659 [Ochrobactrum soli]|uniref:Uncharacterized protein n=1 Tax=Ochrobactrum soli TaxID=2448455 RepID=A0A2P9HCP7_9HYPH|nr:hypothetical protein OHAE_4659 [[Ochrobactrum] soli]